MKKITMKILMLTIILSLTVSEFFSQTRIKFAKGQTSRTISTIVPASSDDFLEWMFAVRGRPGKTMTVTVKSRTGKVHFTGEGRTITRRMDDETDYFIALFNDGKATRFWMTVTIR